MKRNKSSDKEIIFNDANDLYHTYYNCSGILNANYPGKKENIILGQTISIIDLDNYIEEFCKIFDDSKYMIEMSDGSLICYVYQFDSNDKVISFSLSFLPNPDSNILKFKKSNFNGDYYLRLDYEPEKRVKFIHPAIHLHTNLDHEGIRFPINKIVTPLDFLYIVLRYIYGNDLGSSLIESLMQNRTNSLDTYLDNEEKSKLQILINNLR